MDHLCKNCKWWSTEQTCEKVGNDNLIKDKEASFTLDVYSDDDSGLTATLRTGPNFGCVQFEEGRNYAYNHE